MPEAPKPPSGGFILGAWLTAAAAGAWLAVLAVRVALSVARRRARPQAVQRGPSTLSIASGAVAVLVLCAAVSLAGSAERRRATVTAQPAQPVVAPTDALAEIRQAAETLRADGFQTDLVAAVRDAVDQMRGRRVAGLVVLSDGQCTTGNASDVRLNGVRQFARDRGIPLVAVCVGDDSPPKNIRVAGLELPRQIRLEGTVDAKVSVLSRNYDGRSITVRLLRQKMGQTQWQGVGESVQATIGTEEGPRGTDVGPRAADQGPRNDSAGAEKEPTATEVAIRVRGDQEGQFLYKAVVDPLPEEALTNDNSATARMAISNDKVRVLLLSGEAGWEFQYLRNFLLRYPDKYMVSVWQQNADKGFNQEASTAGMQLSELPRTPEALVDKYDVVILVDPAYTEGGFDQTLAKLLNQYVGEYGGGLCYVAAGRHTSDNLAAGSIGGGARSANPFDPLLDVLPVNLGREGLVIPDTSGIGAAQGWPVRLTGVGLDHPVTQLADNPKASREVWDLLPGISGRSRP